METPVRATSAENSDVGMYARMKNRSSSSSNTVMGPRELPTPKSLLSMGRKQALSDVANSLTRSSATRVYGSASGTKIDAKDPHPKVRKVPSDGSASNEPPRMIEARSAKAKTCLTVDSRHDQEQMAKADRLASEMETMSLYNDYADDYDILPKEERLSSSALLNLRGLKPSSVQEDPTFSPPPSPPEVGSFVTGLLRNSPTAQADWDDCFVEAAVPPLEDVAEEEEEEDSEIENMFPHSGEDDDDFDILPKEERLTEADMAVLRDLRGRLWRRTSAPRTSDLLTPPPSPCQPFYIPPPCYEEFMMDHEKLPPALPSEVVLCPVPMEW